jgi:calmodulin
MANPLTEEQIEEYKEAFSLFERDGEITVGTVGTLMRALGHNPTEGDLAETINSVIGDAIHEVGDGDPAVDFVDFVGIMALYTTRHQENEILEAFKVFDQYSTEYIYIYSSEIETKREDGVRIITNKSRVNSSIYIRNGESTN